MTKLNIKLKSFCDCLKKCISPVYLVKLSETVSIIPTDIFII